MTAATMAALAAQWLAAAPQGARVMVDGEWVCADKSAGPWEGESASGRRWAWNRYALADHLAEACHRGQVVRYWPCVPDATLHGRRVRDGFRVIVVCPLCSKAAHLHALDEADRDAQLGAVWCNGCQLVIDARAGRGLLGEHLAVPF